MVTSQLNNLDIFGDPAATIDPALKINKLDPPSSFVYKASFVVTLQVLPPPVEYVAPVTYPPFFIPTPTDMWFYSGDKFIKSFGPTYGQVNHVITVSYDFGKASAFMQWAAATNTISVSAESTSL